MEEIIEKELTQEEEEELVEKLVEEHWKVLEAVLLAEKEYDSYYENRPFKKESIEYIIEEWLAVRDDDDPNDPAAKINAVLENLSGKAIRHFYYYIYWKFADEYPEYVD